MKKILTVLLMFLIITGCSNIKNYKGNLYQVVDNDVINNITVDNIESIDLMSNKYGVGFTVSDKEQISNLLSLFTQISSIEKIEEFELSEDSYNFTINTLDNCQTFVFYENVSEACDGLCYKIENNGGLKKYVEELLTNQFDLNVEYIDLFEYEGLSVRQGKYEVDDNGNFNLEILTNNTSDNDYGIMLKNITVNGIGVNSYQELGCLSQNEIGYTIPITTSVLRNYGINLIGEVNYQIYVYELDSENYELLDRLYTSDVFTIKSDDYSKMDLELILDEPVYNENDIEVYISTSEEDLYTTLQLLIVNNTDEETEVKIDTLEYNDTEVTQLDFYSCDINAQAKMAALFPIYNFEYDEENATTKKIDIETLSLSLRIETESDVYYSDTISLK